MIFLIKLYTSVLTALSSLNDPLVVNYSVAKIVQIEQKTKFYLSFFEMKPIFDLLRSKISIFPQTCKDLRKKLPNA